MENPRLDMENAGTTHGKWMIFTIKNTVHDFPWPFSIAKRQIVLDLPGSLTTKMQALAAA